MKTANYHILLNAEPFGFGPSAAIADVAPLLREYGVHIAYIGEKHTLDLQKNLGYAHIYDITDLEPHARSNLMSKLASEYDLLLSAMDFELALIAQQAGFKTAIYDALAWYWPTLHPAIRGADLYLAQDFCGVRQRIAHDLANFSRCRIIPPLVCATSDKKVSDVVLLNMGGLQNPYWDTKDTLAYARAIVRAIKAVIPPTEQLVVVTSSSVAAALGDPVVRSMERAEVLTTLARTKVAFMTPGLGNIYDAAAFDIPTLWLPPANDSQGQQLQLLMASGYTDDYCDWSECVSPINYDSEQLTVLRGITTVVKALDVDMMLQARFKTVLNKKYRLLTTLKHSKTRELLHDFGSDGGKIVCQEVINYLEGATYERT